MNANGREGEPDGSPDGYSRPFALNFLLVKKWASGYDPDIAGNCDFILSAFQGQNQVASTQIRVNVNGGAYPEPNPNVPDAASTGVLALLGLIPVLGVAHTLRRRPVAS